MPGSKNCENDHYLWLHWIPVGTPQTILAYRKIGRDGPIALDTCIYDIVWYVGLITYLFEHLQTNRYSEQWGYIFLLKEWPSSNSHPTGNSKIDSLTTLKPACKGCINFIKNNPEQIYLLNTIFIILYQIYRYAHSKCQICPTLRTLPGSNSVQYWRVVKQYWRAYFLFC